MINITRRFRAAVLKVAGGATNLMPKVTATVVNPTEKDISVYGTYEYKDGTFLCDCHHLIKAGESEVIEYYAIGECNYEDWKTGTGKTKSYFLLNSITGISVDDGNYYYTQTSNCVNIDDYLVVLDPTKPASYTATLVVD